jgi:hypothetical protein
MTLFLIKLRKKKEKFSKFKNAILWFIDEIEKIKLLLFFAFLK